VGCWSDGINTLCRLTDTCSIRCSTPGHRTVLIDRHAPAAEPTSYCVLGPSCEFRISPTTFTILRSSPDLPLSIIDAVPFGRVSLFATTAISSADHGCDHFSRLARAENRAVLRNAVVGFTQPDGLMAARKPVASVGLETTRMCRDSSNRTPSWSVAGTGRGRAAPTCPNSHNVQSMRWLWRPHRAV